MYLADYKSVSILVRIVLLQLAVRKKKRDCSSRMTQTGNCKNRFAKLRKFKVHHSIMIFSSCKNNVMRYINMHKYRHYRPF